MQQIPVDSDVPIRDKKGFRVVLFWSLTAFLGFILIGYLFRLVQPTQLDLKESEYLEMAFTPERLEVTAEPESDSEFLGFFEPGSIFYVIDRSDDFVMVRPLRMSEFDSVWVQAQDLAIYEEETYRQWAREYEQNVVRELQNR